MPPLTAFLVSLIGLIAAAAIYLGARGTSLIHRLSVVAGVLVVLCISVLPFYLLMAFDNLGSSNYEVAFIAYLAIGGASAVAALGFAAILIWLRPKRPA
jgi:hypothetical protein